MNVHAFMNELDQKDYWYPIKNKKIWKSMYKVNGELSSCDITYSGRVPSREGDIHNFALWLLLNGSSKSAQTFTVGFLKLLSTRPIHIVVWGNFPFKARHNGIALMSTYIADTFCSFLREISFSRVASFCQSRAVWFLSTMGCLTQEELGF